MTSYEQTLLQAVATLPSRVVPMYWRLYAVFA